MTSKIKVDNINKVSDDSNIINKCGSTTTVGSGAGNTIVVCGATVTIGRCGGTVALASGASLTGFGRTGTVDWQTGSIKTATFTAVSGQGFFADTTSGVFNMNLPAGSAGSIVSVQDYNNTFDNNNLTIIPNGSQKINGGGGNLILSTEGQGVTFIYIDTTVGWRSVQDNTFSQQAQSFISATGGTVATCGDFKMHKFTGPGTFCVSSGSGPVALADYFVVAGGGSGGGGASHGGGGGGGGVRVSNTLGCIPAPSMPGNTVTSAPDAIQINPGAIPVTVGGGGAATPTSNPGSTANRGSNSIFSTITSTGGGGGNPSGGGVVGGPAAPVCSQNRGGSGGGGGGPPGNADTTGQGGLGNTPPVSPPQGNPGGNANYSGPNYGSGGGGGAGGSGSGGSSTTGGAGGGGAFVNPIFAPGCAGTPGPASGRYFAGGGGGSSFNGGSPGSGGDGGGGTGATAPSVGTAGTTNTGGGGGGGSLGPPAPSYVQGAGGAGGSGYVLIRYKFQ